MKRMSLGIVLLAAAAVCVPGTAAAQGTGVVQFGLSGGATFPTSDQSDVYKTGWNGSALLTFNFGHAPVGLRVDGSYHELETKDNLVAFLGTGKTKIVSGTFDVVVGPRGQAFEPYVIGGGGVYDLRFNGTEVDTGNVFEESTTRFGWNAGLGFAFPLGSDRTRMFIEGRYTSISIDTDRFSNSVHTSGRRFTIIPVNLGILF